MEPTKITVHVKHGRVSLDWGLSDSLMKPARFFCSRVHIPRPHLQFRVSGIGREIRRNTQVLEKARERDNNPLAECLAKYPEVEVTPETFVNFFESRDYVLRQLVERLRAA